MTLRSAIKQNAKRSLKGHWGRILLILLIFIGVNILLSGLDNAIFSTFGFHRIIISLDASQLRQIIINYPAALPRLGEIILSLLLALVRLIIMAPLTLGIINWALELSDGRMRPVSSLFWAFDNAAFGRSIWLKITVAVKTGLFGLVVSLVPMAFITIGTVLRMRETGSWAFGSLLIALGSLLSIVSGIATMWFSARYFAAKLLLCDRYYYTVREATRLSVAATRGHRWQIVGFYLSFLPWLLLCAFVLPLLYVIPYITMASVMMARFLFEDYLMGEKKLDLSDPDRLIVDDISPDAYAAARGEAVMDHGPAAEPSEKDAPAPEEDTSAGQQDIP